MNDKKRIIICIIQKFLFAYKAFDALAGSNFAIIVDETHQVDFYITYNKYFYLNFKIILIILEKIVFFMTKSVKYATIEKKIILKIKIQFDYGFILGRLAIWMVIIRLKFLKK